MRLAIASLARSLPRGKFALIAYRSPIASSQTNLEWAERQIRQHWRPKILDSLPGGWIYSRSTSRGPPEQRLSFDPRTRDSPVPRICPP